MRPTLSVYVESHTRRVPNFYLNFKGNSNNIASIDVNAGYIGLDSYNEFLVGLLIFCNTFSATLLIFFGFWEEKSEEDALLSSKKKERLENV